MGRKIGSKRCVKERSWQIVWILPRWIWGPGDSAPTASGKLLLDFLKQKLPGIVDGGSSIVDARDVPLATITAAYRALSGERYIVGRRYFDFARFMPTLGPLSGVPAS